MTQTQTEALAQRDPLYRRLNGLQTIVNALTLGLEKSALDDATARELETCSQALGKARGARYAHLSETAGLYGAELDDHLAAVRARYGL